MKTIEVIISESVEVVVDFEETEAVEIVVDDDPEIDVDAEAE